MNSHPNRTLAALLASGAALVTLVGCTHAPTSKTGATTSSPVTIHSTLR